MQLVLAACPLVDNIKYSELEKLRKATKLKLQKLVNELTFKQGHQLDSDFCQATDPSYLNLIR